MAEGEFGELLRHRMRAQADMFAALTSHPTLVGQGREAALTELLRQVLPRRFEVLSGAIAAAPKRPSASQLDIIVADTMDYPTLLRIGDTAVVLPHAVRAVVEVKSDLKRGEFADAASQIGRARLALQSDNLTALFCFGSPTRPETLREWLTDVITERERRRQVALDESDPEKAQLLLEDVAVLGAAALPSLVLSEKGAIAQRVEADSQIVYRFLRSTDSIPAVMVLVDQMLATLSTSVSLGAASPHIQAAYQFASDHIRQLPPATDNAAKPIDDLIVSDPPPRGA